jgi:hypothetical protein
VTYFDTIDVPRKRPRNSAGAIDDGFHVYALCDPRVDTIRYVGVTRVPLECRLYEHIHCTPRGVRRAAWIKSLKQDGVAPTIRLLEEANDETTMFLLEQEWISSLREIGIDLANGTDGGDNPPRPPLGNQYGVGQRGPSPLRGRPMTKEAKEKMRGPRPKRRGIPWSDERREQQDAKSSGRTECKRGHDLTDPANVRLVPKKGILTDPNGSYAQCRVCHNEQARNHYDRSNSS